MSPRLSVCAVIAVCLLSCSQTDSTSNEPFSDTKTDLTLGLTKTYFGSPWAESDDITIDFSGDAISFIGYFEGKNSPPKDRSAVVSYVAAPSGEVLYDLSQFASLEAAIAAHRPFTSQSLGLDATALIHWPVADDVEPSAGSTPSALPCSRKRPPRPTVARARRKRAPTRRRARSTPSSGETRAPHAARST
jgi:hypothetical protein